MSSVCIVIPIYKPVLDETERRSLRSLAAIMPDREKAIISPDNLVHTEAQEIIPGARREFFDSCWFKNRNTYNALMMSEQFYSRFSAYDYILIYQTDAYLFSDKLDEFMQRDYDYIGAPWVLRPIYNRWPVSWIVSLKHSVRTLFGLPDLRRTWWRVGNGGLSLRKVASHLQVVRSLYDTIDVFKNHPDNHLYNEDVFFSTEVARHGIEWRVPTWQEALGFAYDIHPEVCYKLTGGALPMGCHSWQHPRRSGFWLPIINDVEAKRDCL